jgi:hypothetical protein
MHGTLERIYSVKDHTKSNMTQFSLIFIIAVFFEYREYRYRSQ